MKSVHKETGPIMKLKSPRDVTAVLRINRVASQGVAKKGPRRAPPSSTNAAGACLQRANKQSSPAPRRAGKTVLRPPRATPRHALSVAPRQAAPPGRFSGTMPGATTGPSLAHAHAPCSAAPQAPRAPASVNANVYPDTSNFLRMLAANRDTQLPADALFSISPMTTTPVSSGSGLTGGAKQWSAQDPVISYVPLRFDPMMAPITDGEMLSCEGRPPLPSPTSMAPPLGGTPSRPPKLNCKGPSKEKVVPSAGFPSSPTRGPTRKPKPPGVGAGSLPPSGRKHELTSDGAQQGPLKRGRVGTFRENTVGLTAEDVDDLLLGPCPRGRRSQCSAPTAPPRPRPAVGHGNRNPPAQQRLPAALPSWSDEPVGLFFDVNGLNKSPFVFFNNGSF